MSNKSFVLTLMFGALLTSVAVLNSHAASVAPTPAAPTVAASLADEVTSTDERAVAFSCNEVLCHSTVDCSTGTTPCGVCVIPPGSFFGHCGLKK